MKQIFLLLILLFFNQIAEAQALVKVIPEKIVVLPRGESPWEFPFIDTGNKDSFTQPSGPRFDKDGNLSIYDPATYSDKIFDSLFHYRTSIFFPKRSIYPLDPIRRIESVGENYYYFLGRGGILSLDMNTQKYDNYSFDRDPLGSDHVHFIGRSVFYWDKDGYVFCFPEPLVPGKPKSSYNEAGIRELLALKDNRLLNIDFDKDGILYVNSKPYLDEARAVIKYFLIKDPVWLKNTIHKAEFDEGAIFIGRDASGHTFWTNYNCKVLWVMDSAYYVISFMQIAKIDNIMWGGPICMHPSGDVYLIGYDNIDGNSTALYRIKKTW